VQLEHTFTVPVPVEQAWKVLLDIERVAPCLPGATLATVDGDDFTGSVKVRLGPIGLTYKGKASFVEKDQGTYRAVIDAHGKDARGNGTAAAKVIATLVGQGDSTQVVVLTDLNITGKPAQFGRGVMVDVGNKLIGQFADCLAGKLAAGEEPAPADTDADGLTTTPEVASAPAGTSAPAPIPEPARTAVKRVRPEAREAEAIDLLGSAGPAVAKRLFPLATVPVLVVLAYLFGRRSARKSSARKSSAR
jgi:carbon monoxide dehydrogenase subunit G